MDELSITPVPDLFDPVDMPKVSSQQQAYLTKGLEGAANTERAYKSDLNQYKKWCDQAQLPALPATPEQVGQYVSSLATDKKKWATIARRLAAIRKWHVLHDQNSPLDDRWLKATLKGIQRTHGVESEHAQAFTADVLKKALRALETERRGVPQFSPLRDKIALLVGFTGAFRRSELVALNVENIHFYEDSVVISYQGSKTSQTRQQEEKAFFYSADAAICPVRCLQLWVRLLDRHEGPLLVRVRRGNELTEDRLTDQSIDAIVKRRLGKEYSAHSLRVAFVTISKINGADDSEVMWQTKYKTADMIRRYTRFDSVKKNNARKKLNW